VAPHIAHRGEELRSFRLRRKNAITPQLVGHRGRRPQEPQRHALGVEVVAQRDAARSRRMLAATASSAINSDK